MFAMLGVGVEKVLCDVVVWLEEVRQDVCNMQSDIVVLQREAQSMRGELDRLRAEVAQMQRKERFRELAAQEAKVVFSDAGEERRRLARVAREVVAEEAKLVFSGGACGNGSRPRLFERGARVAE
jgi:hypothetical protein